MVIGLSAGSLIRSVIIRVINKIKSNLFNCEYDYKGRWAVLDIYLDASHLSIYPPLYSSSLWGVVVYYWRKIGSVTKINRGNNLLSHDEEISWRKIGLVGKLNNLTSKLIVYKLHYKLCKFQTSETNCNFLICIKGLQAFRCEWNM